MKERPIIFSGPMVRAILEGRKTMTRRVVDKRWQGFQYACPLPETVDTSGGSMDFPGRTPGDMLFHNGLPIRDGEWQPVGCPYGQPGDRLWVRETWVNATTNDKPGFIYQADPLWATASREFRGFAWKSPRFMPRLASRLLLEIVSIRIERVQDISENDARAEGVEKIDDIAYKDYYPRQIGIDLGWKRGPKENDYGCGSAKLSFRSLWDSINAEHGYGWDANPWVWVVEFRRIEA